MLTVQPCFTVRASSCTMPLMESPRAHGRWAALSFIVTPSFVHIQSLTSVTIILHDMSIRQLNAGLMQTVKETVVGSPETATEKAQRIATETAGTASQKAQDVGSKAAGHASDIARDAQDAYNRQHGDSAYQKVSSACLKAAPVPYTRWWRHTTRHAPCTCLALGVK